MNSDDALRAVAALRPTDRLCVVSVHRKSGPGAKAHMPKSVIRALWVQKQSPLTLAHIEQAILEEWSIPLAAQTLTFGDPDCAQDARVHHPACTCACRGPGYVVHNITSLRKSDPLPFHLVVAMDKMVNAKADSFFQRWMSGAGKAGAGAGGAAKKSRTVDLVNS